MFVVAMSFFVVLKCVSMNNLVCKVRPEIINNKGAATDMRYFARSKFSRSLVYKKNFSLRWQVVFKLGYVFCQIGYLFWVWMNSRQICKQAKTKLSLAYIFSENVFHWSKFKACSHDLFFSWTFDLLLIDSRYLVIGVYLVYAKEIFIGNQTWNTNHKLVSDINVQKTCFLM